MALYLRGVKLAFAGGVTEAQKKVMALNVTKAGGNVAQKGGIMAAFGSAKNVFEGLTHIVVENRDVSLDHLSHAVGITDTSMVNVVHTSWLVACTTGKKKVDETPYLVHPKNSPTVEVATESQNSAESDNAEPRAKKPRLDPTQQSAIPYIRSMLMRPVHLSSGEWTSLDESVFFKLQTANGSIASRIAGFIGFDLDGTLVIPKSGDKFAKDPSDWRWLYPDIPTKLRRLHEEGNRIAIISNQSGVPQYHTLSEVQQKFDNVASALGVPVDMFFAVKKDLYRKPCTGWSNATVPYCTCFRACGHI
jgi:DNA 3'-phosphatase